VESTYLDPGGKETRNAILTGLGVICGAPSATSGSAAYSD
jgi:hypothetical protein